MTFMSAGLMGGGMYGSGNKMFSPVIPASPIPNIPQMPIPNIQQMPIPSIPQMPNVQQPVNNAMSQFQNWFQQMQQNPQMQQAFGQMFNHQPAQGIPQIGQNGVTSQSSQFSQNGNAQNNIGGNRWGNGFGTNMQPQNGNRWGNGFGTNMQPQNAFSSQRPSWMNK